MTSEKKIDDGGPAFPIVTTETNEHGISFPLVQPGMTLRQWYAGQAISSMGQYYPEVAAKKALQFADALIAAERGDL